MIDRRIKFRHIQCFVEICREGSLKIAADKLSLTQPAISKTLRELEQTIGKRLLSRNRAGIALTAEGDIFLRYATQSIAALQQGIDGIHKRGQAAKQNLSVGVLPSVAARLIPKVVEIFVRAEPDAVLRIADGPHGFLTDQLKLGRLDYVIGRMGPHDQMKGVSFTPLYQERVRLVVRHNHPLLEGASLAEVLDWPVVYPTENSAIRSSVDRLFLEQGIGQIPRLVETVSGAFGRVYVQHSDAVWIISEGVVANEIERGALVALPFNTDTTIGQIGIMAREDWEPTSAGRRFQSIIRESSLNMSSA